MGRWGARSPHSGPSRPSDRDLGGLALGLGGNGETGVGDKENNS
ncbi:MAG: hypothetical protein ACHBN1_06480 [Heteroscytonema crispum UTEX LB 1556]